ncbi:isocitrate lyase/phosphoenolpyruvate mutase family protein [Agrococcus sp. HG114]|uniref:isocitrate lyase/PEP mutase family protein n=1 Tax=Agrococcus sp. HG114 TaxID=2969757 RepID=UPI00215B1740|nr:isocitrate lyase/phosphoenolpyruvate mutase family protein [Agrococcus sp. HG114]MCR8669679.1 isocitrate lyase/phosphoenolpyruvate mutase family protein [Agrococcus sp. HG114]
MRDLAGLAAELLTMHDDFVVLPTAWDAWSARALVDAGFRAITVGSHPVAESRGQRDGEGMSLDDALDAVGRITASVDVPVSADLESGYGAEPRELIGRLLDAGAVGLNVEDTVHAQGRMREPHEHADYVAALRAAADEAGVDVVINGRTDAFARPDLHGLDPLEQAILRCELMEQAGAQALYPVRPPSAEAVSAILERVSLPVNVTAHPVSGTVFGDLAATRAGGARRVSFGPRLQAALTDSIAELVRPWR